ncbi:hypothetical protein VTN00DRAFT_2257 [Thermoascus crustaceus]|uniref:uncharacterized protein n=1 Tax=Thermoascus crustaceus TaxID=5088 RepID=UPI003742A9C4
MDLSSFEGPPVNDTRFSISQYSKDMPRPRISISCWNDRSVDSNPASSFSSSRAELSQPKSTEAPSPSSSRSRYQYQYQNGKQQQQRTGGVGGHGPRRSPGIIIKSSWPGCSRSDNGEELAVERRRPRSAGMPISFLHEHSASNRPSHARSYSNLTEASSRTSNNIQYSGHRAQSPGTQRTTSSDRLVWLEDQQVWVMTDSSDVPPNPHPRNASRSRSPSLSSSYTREEYWRSSPPREPPQASSYPPINIHDRSYTEERFDPDDLPPPYESLGFNVRNTPRLAHESRWSAVARRVGRLAGSGE